MGLFNDLTNPTPNISRNAFDRSSREVFSAKVGQYQIVKAIHTMPNAEYEIDLQQLCRMDAVVGSPFTRLKLNYEFAYVDYNHIYSSFNEFVAQREDKQLANQPRMDKIPYMPFYAFISNLCILYLTDYVATVYANTIWSDGTPRYVLVSKHMPWIPVSFSVVRNLDMLGYINLLPYLHYHIKNIDAYVRNSGTITTAVIGTALQRTIESHVTESFNNFFGRSFESVNNGVDDVFVNLWSPCAYNRCWFEYKRNSYYDFSFELISHADAMTNYTLAALESISKEGANIYSFLDGFVGTNDVVYNSEYVRLFNLDDKTDFDLADSTLFYSNFCRLLSIFAVKPIPYKKDMFTGVLPSTQFGDVSVFTETDTWKNLYIFNEGNSEISDLSPLVADGSISPNTRGLVGVKQFDDDNIITKKFKFDPAVAISVLSQRRADAMQRFSERMLRAGDKTYKNFKAHWGVVPKSILNTQPTFLGAYDGVIEINSVAATSNNDNTDLGELGGNGVGVVSGHKVHFKSTGFGVILITFYVEKPSEYDSFGINRFNQILDVWDLPYPEFANISLVPVDSYSLNAYGSNHDILGYLPRFFEHKTDIDSVHGEFYNSSPLASLSDTSGFVVDDDKRGGVFSQYVTPRHSYGSADTVNFLYISPSSVDNIFVSASDALQSSDQFKINCNIDCKAVLPLSVVGLPQ